MPDFDFQWIQTIVDFFSQLFNSSLEQILTKYGYQAIVILTLLEGETIVIIAGFFASKGILNPWLIALCAFSGSFTSDQVMFSLGKYKGAAILRHFPKVERNVGRAAGLLKKYDTALILGFRFVYGVRNVTPILLGISGISHKKFFLLNFIGAAVWALAFTAGGFFFGKVFGSAAIYMLGVLLLIIISILLYQYIKRKKNPPVEDDTTTTDHLAELREMFQDSTSYTEPEESIENAQASNTTQAPGKQGKDQ